MLRLFVCLYAVLSVAVCDIWTDYYAIPKEFLNYADLEALGLSKYSHNSKQIFLSSLQTYLSSNRLFRNDSTVVVPEGSSLMFLFNTSMVLDQQQQQEPNTTNGSSNHNYLGPETQFAHTSLPLGLPKCHSVVDFALMVPRKQKEFVPLTTAGTWLTKLGYIMKEIPVTDSLMDSSRPFLVFVFDATTQNTQNTQETRHRYLTGGLSHSNQTFRTTRVTVENSLKNSSSEIAKAVIQNSDGFFDSFAKIWVQELGTETLVQSVFCQVNELVRELTYCLKVIESGAEASVISKNPFRGEEKDSAYSIKITNYIYTQASKLRGILSDLNNHKSVQSVKSINSINMDEDGSNQKRSLPTLDVVRNKIRISAVGKHFRKLLPGRESKEKEVDDRKEDETHKPSGSDSVYRFSYYQLQSDDPFSESKVVTTDTSIDTTFNSNNTGIAPESIISPRGLYFSTKPVNKENCTIITWKKVFLSSLRGEPNNFCTKRVADERLANNKE